MDVSIVEDISTIPAQQWDALVDKNDPFMEHAFLQVLEQSGSVEAATGWQPAHVVVHDGETLVGACPVYIKDHSYGEYIFDWGWAEGAQRAGIPYYPKLVTAAPFTPATGRRLLTGPGAPREDVIPALVAGIQAVAKAVNASSFHLLFLTEAEQAILSSQPALLARDTHQYHWTNNDYTDFDHWLSTFRSKARKETRRERRAAAATVDRIRAVPGNDLGDREWAAIHRFYIDTCTRKWGTPYLTPEFFSLARTQLAHRIICFVAEKDDDVVATSLTFQKGTNLYGRYWGCSDSFPALHFELCYHAPIALCIENGWTRFEAGAQGQHKIKRGLMPSVTRSIHWIRHHGLAHAIDHALQKERKSLHEQLPLLARHGPFRRNEANSNEMKEEC